MRTDKAAEAPPLESVTSKGVTLKPVNAPLTAPTEASMPFDFQVSCSVEKEYGLPASTSGAGVTGGGVGSGDGDGVASAVASSGSDDDWKESNSRKFKL